MEQAVRDFVDFLIPIVEPIGAVVIAVGVVALIIVVRRTISAGVRESVRGVLGSVTRVRA